MQQQPHDATNKINNTEPLSTTVEAVVRDAFKEVQRISSCGGGVHVLSMEQRRFLLPLLPTTITEQGAAPIATSPTTTTSEALSPIDIAATNLTTAIINGKMPSLCDVGLLKDEASLLQYVDGKGNEWLKGVRKLLMAGGGVVVGNDATAHQTRSPMGSPQSSTESTTSSSLSLSSSSIASLTTAGRRARAIHAIAALCCGSAFETSIGQSTASSSSSASPAAHGNSTTSALAPLFVGDVPITLRLLDQHPSIITCRLVAARLLFNFRITVGTITAIGVYGFSLPTTNLLVGAFRKPHCPPREIISVGARALAKHVHRDNTLSWWGNHHLKGSQAQKNAAGDAVLFRIINGADGGGGEATAASAEGEGSQSPTGASTTQNTPITLPSSSSSSWRNFHILPHNFVAYELRVPEGYGARWQLAIRGVGGGGENSAVMGGDGGEEETAAPAAAAVVGADAPTGNNTTTTTTPPTTTNFGVELSPDDLSFRGFLEPHEADGHAKGWRH